MSAEHAIAAENSGLLSRWRARTSRPLIEAALSVEDELEGLTVSPGELLALIGRSSNGERALGKDNYWSELTPAKLATELMKLHVLTPEQYNVMLYAVAQRFADEAGIPAEYFMNGYTLLSGLTVRNKQCGLYQWPIDHHDMYLDGSSMANIGNFAARLEQKTHAEQPYLVDFVTGGGHEHFLHRDGTKPKDVFEASARQRLVFAGVGLASLHLENLLDFHEQEAASLADPGQLNAAPTLQLS